MTSSPSLYDVFLVENPRHGHPFPLLSITTGDVSVASLMIFRLRLLLHCSELACDAGMFCATQNRVRSSTCPICGGDVESIYHFVVACPALNTIRDVWLEVSNPQVLFDHVVCRVSELSVFPDQDLTFFEGSSGWPTLNFFFISSCNGTLLFEEAIKKKKRVPIHVYATHARKRHVRVLNHVTQERVVLTQ